MPTRIRIDPRDPLSRRRAAAMASKRDATSNLFRRWFFNRDSCVNTRSTPLSTRWAIVMRTKYLRS